MMDGLILVYKKVDPKTLEEIKVDWARVAGSSKSISYDQFKKLMTQMPENNLKILWSMYDLNKDNVLSWVEYICVVVRLMNGTTAEKISLIFNCMDTDNSGYLSKEEFLFAAQKFATHHTNVEEFVNIAFKACDADHNKKVSLVEFIKWAQSDPAMFSQIVGTFNPFE